MSGIDRRTFLKGVGAAALTAWAGPPLLSRVASASQGWGPDSGLFAYGVASGDPLPSGITLWTRAKGPSGIPDVTSVDWKLALDPEFSTIVVSGSSGVSVENDYCAVVAVDGLDPGMNYYYKFEAGTDTSPIGRTRTAPDPASSVNGLRFAIASCQDFQAGYYHAWKHMAQQDLDFVMFLGDYIYEYGTEEHRLRPHDPSGEIFTLDDYRRRYRHYRGDPWLREAHRLHPFIVVWDDHEVANDRWGNPAPGGAENHDSDEGPYQERLAAAMQTYFEYMPIRRPDPNDPTRIYRGFTYGSLADIFMLDTRSYRDEPKGTFLTNPIANLNHDISDPSRTLLGSSQKMWLKQGLQNSTRTWKLLGNQVMLAHLSFGNIPDAIAQPLSELTKQPSPVRIHRDGIPVNHDQWDGYQPERREILEHIGTHAPNTVVLTGDIHTSWAIELFTSPGNNPVEEPVAVEFVGPSITSINLNELVGEAATSRTGSPQPAPHRSSIPVEATAIANNPHIRWCEFDSNGYTLIEMTDELVRATYLHVMNPDEDVTTQPVTNPDAKVDTAPLGVWEVRHGSARLHPVVAAVGSAQVRSR